MKNTISKRCSQHILGIHRNWYLCSLFFLFSFSTSQAQLCLELPDTYDEVMACNASIAAAFAPEIQQHEGHTPKADIPTIVNYDNNWDAIDNWENLEDHDINPSVYYAVWWLEDYWLIRYYLYYPRDYSRFTTCAIPCLACGPIPLCTPCVLCLACLADQHEHDIERVEVFVKRPKTQAEVDSFWTLEYGTGLSHHGNMEYASCPDANIVSDGSPYTGIHPKVFVSPGSHAIYYSEQEASTDGYLGICTPLTLSKTQYVNNYELIDIFNPPNGLWAQNDNPNLWDEDGKFLCDVGDCKAGIPWGGNGKAPACDHFMGISQLCNVDSSHTIDSSECDSTLFNGYACPEIWGPTEICMWEPTPYYITGLSTTASTINWNLPLGFKISPDPDNPKNGFLLLVTNPISPGTYTFNVPYCPISTFTVTVLTAPRIDLYPSEITPFPKEEYCEGNPIFMDATKVLDELTYGMEIARRPINASTNFVTVFEFNENNALPSTRFNLLDFTADRGFVFEAGYEYNLNVSFDNQCLTSEIEVHFRYLNSPAPAFELKDENGIASNEFCSDDAVWVDGNMARDVISYKIALDRRVAGSTAPFEIYYRNNTQYSGLSPLGSIAAFDLGQRISAHGYALEAGYEYRFYLSVDDVCFGQSPYPTEVLKDFTISECFFQCRVPENLRCEHFETYQLVWDEVPFAETYEVDIKLNHDACDCEGTFGALIDPEVVQTPTYQLPTWLYPHCFAWRVKANCHIGESDYSEFACFNTTNSCNATLRTNADPTSNMEAEIQTLQTKISPNPNSGEMQIEVNASQSFELQFDLYTVNGKWLRHFDKGQIRNGQYTERWQVRPFLSPGLYFLKIQTSLGTRWEKILISY